MITDVEIIKEGGSCPYQITGKIFLNENVCYFYFRSRHDEASIEIYETTEQLDELDDSKCIFKDAIFFKESERAGYINQKQAHNLANFFLEEFRNHPSKYNQ